MTRGQVNASVLVSLAFASLSLAQGTKPVGETRPPARTSAQHHRVPGRRSLESVIIAKEKEVWEAIKRKDRMALGNLLADDIVASFGNGLLGKSEVIKRVRNESVSRYAMEDMKVTLVSDDAAFLVYKATEKSSGQEGSPARPVSVSSYWVRRGGRWLNTFHQERPK